MDIEPQSEGSLWVKQACKLSEHGKSYAQLQFIQVQDELELDSGSLQTYNHIQLLIFHL